MSDTSFELGFPKAGIDVSMPFWRQPARQLKNGVYGKTCARAVNVRCFEPGLHRGRGGQRPGLSKYVSARPNGANIVQDLNILVGTYDPPGGSMQTSNSGRVVTLVAVVQGQIRVLNAGDTAWTTPTNNTGNNPPLNFTGVMQSAANQQKLWFADGANRVFYRPSDNTINTWTLTAGTFPVDASGNEPRLICTWRGRTVQSGLLEDAQNWFMSAVDDPLDYDYSPTSLTATQAVAGNNGPLGLIGDVVTGLVPWSDDRLFMGGDQSIHMFSGDPMDGGSIDKVASIGMAWGQAWCISPIDQTIFFFSNYPAVYALSPNGNTERISAAIDPLLRDVNTGENTIRLLWNDVFQGFHVFITPTASAAATTHYFFEQRTGAWWQDDFVDKNMNPQACCTFDGNLAQDRVPLIGSWDGYVRAVDDEADDDDGEVIRSEVVLGPLLTKDLDDVLHKDMQAVLGEDSGDVNFYVYVANTAEKALADIDFDRTLERGALGTPRYIASGTWRASRNLSTLVRRAGHAVYVRITATNYWALEQIRSTVSLRGLIRRRGA